MGMFDYIKFEIECPVCKEKVKDFQSKDGPCMLTLLEYWEVNNFYASCPKCLCWIEFDKINKIVPNKIVPITDYKMTVESANRNITFEDLNINDNINDIQTA
jgi:hypothetical protein